MRITGRIGLVLVIVAAASWSGWTLWSSTRKWVPASVPVSLAKNARTQTGEFEINVTGPYEITVEANKTSSISLNQLGCSLGTGAIWPEKTCPNPSVLVMTWAVKGGGKMIAHGSSDQMPGGGTTPDSAMRSIGYFRGERGQRYKLTVDSLSDASSLSAANPRLKVSVGGTIYEFNLFISSLIMRGSAAVAAIGIVLLLASAIFGRKSGARREVVTG